jgi:hypothetical protein
MTDIGFDLAALSQPDDDHPWTGPFPGREYPYSHSAEWMLYHADYSLLQLGQYQGSKYFYPYPSNWGYNAVGQWWDVGDSVYYVEHTYLMFDNTDIPVDAVIDTVTLRGGTQAYVGPNTADVVLEVYPWLWAEKDGDSDDPAVSNNWLSGKDLQGLPLLASFTLPSGSVYTDGWVLTDFTSTAAFLDYVNRGGWTKLVVVSKAFRQEDVPPGGNVVDLCCLAFPIVTGYGSALEGKETVLDVEWH